MFSGPEASFFGGFEYFDALNMTYNIADLVNKTAFGLAIWAAAKQDSRTSQEVG